MVRQAIESQRNVLAGLSDDRMRVVRARLLTDGDDPVTVARLDVVDRELQRREQVAGCGGRTSPRERHPGGGTPTASPPAPGDVEVFVAHPSRQRRIGTGRSHGPGALVVLRRRGGTGAAAVRGRPACPARRAGDGGGQRWALPCDACARGPNVTKPGRVLLLTRSPIGLPAQWQGPGLERCRFVDRQPCLGCRRLNTTPAGDVDRCLRTHTAKPSKSPMARGVSFGDKGGEEDGDGGAGAGCGGVGVDLAAVAVDDAGDYGES